MKKKIKKHLSQTQTIALGFLIIILTGTLLLMLPVSTRTGQTTSLLEACFTAVSASCVTGLVVVDTNQHWTVFGQLVILCMIQIGGLGFMTIGVLFSIILRRKIGLRERGLMQESVNTLKIGGIIKLTKLILKGTLFFEGIGALILGIRFSFDLGFWKGMYYGVFHAVSAFCNAGFDLMGFMGEYHSLVAYSGDIVVNIVIMALIIIGGLGFIVWEDIYTNHLQFKKYRLHSKIVIVTTFILIFGGTVLFYLFERKNTFAGMGGMETALSALFSSVTARTAGFNTVDTGALTDAGKLLTIMLMFIGGSPGSTAGGIKTTTLIVLLMYLWSSIRHSYSCNIFNRRLEQEAINRASAVFSTNLFIALAAALVILFSQAIPMSDLLFEVFSAIGTVGMSTGITRELNVVSRITIMLLMYCGRIGSLSFALSFTQTKKVAPVQQPVEKINIG